MKKILIPLIISITIGLQSNLSFGLSLTGSESGNKTQAVQTSAIKSYEPGVTAEYGLNNHVPSMVVEGDYIYYLTADYNIYHLRIKEKNISTGATRTLVDQEGVYSILGKRNDLIYYAKSTDEIYDSAVFTGQHTAELRAINVKTMEDKVVSPKEKVNDFLGGMLYYLGENYIYKFKEFRTLYAIPIDKVNSSKWNPIYKKDTKNNWIDIISVGQDDSLYGIYGVETTSEMVTLIRIKPDGQISELGKFKFIQDIIQHGDWVYISGYCDLSRVNKNTKEVQVLQKDASIINIQYPWLYYFNGEYNRMKLDSPTPITQQINVAYWDLYGAYSKLPLYKDKGYLIENHPDKVYKIFTIDTNTWEKKEVLDNRQ